MVGLSPHAIVLFNFGCGGDESRLCCNAPVFGQRVVALGVLTRYDAPKGIHWGLENATLCEPGHR
jgi:hypothetical protein